MSDHNKNDANALLQARKELIASIAPQMIEKYIVDAVLAICDNNQEPSREKIIAWLKTQIDNTPSALTETEQDLDIIRASLESAMVRIESTYRTAQK